MLQLSREQSDQIVDLCRRLSVQTLELFGSAARDDFEPARSDADFLFAFDDHLTGVADRFFELKEGLERLLGRDVDLVSLHDIQNPYFLQGINKLRIPMYAA